MSDKSGKEMSVKKAADELGVDPRTVRRWCDMGLLESRRVSPLPGSPRRVSEESVRLFIEQRSK